MKQFEVKAIVTMVFPNVGAKSIDEAIAKVAEKIPVTINNKVGIACGITIDDFEVKCYDLIDETNNHDPQLVECINKAWNDETKRKDFITIVDCLAKRDIDEFINPEFYAMRDDKERCREYCQNIADDKDLDTILCYCRM